MKVKVEDLRPRGAGWAVRLYEKSGKQHAMLRHHALAEALRAYIDAAGIAEDRKGWLFRTARRLNGSILFDKAMSQPGCLAHDLPARRGGRHCSADWLSDVPRHRDHRLPCQRRRARARAGNGGALEPAHTKPYDRTKERLAQDEVERIGLSFPHHRPACSSWITGRPLLRAGRHVLAHCRRERNVECG
jgi:hypothetical protein